MKPTIEMKIHFHIDTCLLIGPVRLAIRSDWRDWHKQGFTKRESRSAYLPMITTTRELGVGWFAIAVLSECPNPTFHEDC